VDGAPRALAAALAAVIVLLCGCAQRPGAAASVAHAASPSAPAGAVGPVSSPGHRSARADRQRPNIVFVLTDDLAWNLVRYMPHVLAAERRGETFTNYFVTDSLCCPSRASIFTGSLPHNTRILSNGPRGGGFAVFHERGEERHTFAAALQGSGYTTALMGKYLNGYRPGAAEGGQSPSVPPGWSEWDVVGDGYPEYGYKMNSDGQVSAYGYEPQDYLTNVLAGKGLGFIESAAARREPFLLEIATFAPHSPFTPAPHDEQDFPGLAAPRTPAFDAANISAGEWLQRPLPLDAEQLETINSDFRERAQAVQAVDRMIGQIEAELERTGVANSTYFVFSSDNGLHMGEHRLMPGKLTAFDTDIKVPLIVTGPGVPAGRVVTRMTENIDLCPTFEQLGGARAQPNVDGHSLVGLLHGRRVPNWRREILVEHHRNRPQVGNPDLPQADTGDPPSYEAIRMADSLYVEYADGEREYFDLRRDPFELRNLASDLSPRHARALHHALLRNEACHGARSCWRAQHAATRRPHRRR
jgi:N-acetylglucosamine-6-sulfatase